MLLAVVQGGTVITCWGLVTDAVALLFLSYSVSQNHAKLHALSLRRLHSAATLAGIMAIEASWRLCGNHRRTNLKKLTSVAQLLHIDTSESWPAKLNMLAITAYISWRHCRLFVHDYAGSNMTRTRVPKGPQLMKRW